MISLNIAPETAAALAGAQALVRSGEVRGLTPSESLEQFAKLHSPLDPDTMIAGVGESLSGMTTAMAGAARIIEELAAAVQAAIAVAPQRSDAELAAFAKSFDECSSMVKLSADEAGFWLQRLTKIADAFAQS